MSYSNDPRQNYDNSTALTTLKTITEAIYTIAQTLIEMYTFSKGQSLSRATATTTPSTVFTVPDTRQYTVNAIDVINTDSTTHSFSIYLVPPNDTASQGNALFYNVSIAGNSTFHWAGAQVITAGYSIQTSADSALVNIAINGGSSNVK